ncbi:MarR family transcriptional regulator [Phenylobacterium sp.]|uniref:MarR family transcriptional regulator n=1 Tax=Phenylobacterium sp. TaxID=1871053 RepID=UPI0035C826F3
MVLELLDDAPRTVGALGSRLDTDTGTITPLLERLDAAGLITRTRDPDDERAPPPRKPPRSRDRMRRHARVQRLGEGGMVGVERHLRRVNVTQNIAEL